MAASEDHGDYDDGDCVGGGVVLVIAVMTGASLCIEFVMVRGRQGQYEDK